MAVTPTQIAVSTSVPALTLAAGTTGGVAVANSIDPVNDYALIYTSSLTATQGINRNTLLNLSSQPLGKTDTQTGISNKTFVAPVLGAATATSINGLGITSSTGTLTIANGKTLTASNSLTLAGTDSTTMTFPGSSDTVVGLAATQTLTNKTLTSPAIGTSILDTNSNTLVGLTATASAVNYLTIADAATSTAVKIGSAGSDTNVNLNLTTQGSGVIQLNGTPITGAWTSWTPTWTNVTIGNSTVNASYVKIGRTVIFNIQYTQGSTGSVSGSITFSLPVTAVASITGFSNNIGGGVCSLAATGNTWYSVIGAQTSTTVVQLYVGTTAGQMVNTSSTAPFTWTTNSVLTVNGTYQAAS